MHSAILTGFDESKSDALLVYPADDFINTQIIDKMYGYFLKGYHVVVASRFIKGGSMRNCPFPKNLLVRLGNFSLFDKKFSQSFLSLSEILLLNYVKISTNCQFGLLDLISLEKTQVS